MNKLGGNLANLHLFSCPVLGGELLNNATVLKINVVLVVHGCSIANNRVKVQARLWVLSL
jgi:hypothetical protein